MEKDQDVVVIGAGLSGLATALSAARRGRRVVVLERSDQLGGAAAYSAGQVWIPANHVMLRDGIEDSFEDGVTYVTALAKAYPEFLDEEAMHRWLRTAPVAARYFEEAGAVRWTTIPGYPDYFLDAPGSREDGRYVSAEFETARLGPWRDRMNISPHFPIGTTYAEFFSGTGHQQEAAPEDGATSYSAFGTTADDAPEDEPVPDLLTFGTGVVAGFVVAAAEHDLIELRSGVRVTELLVEDGAVVGVRAAGAGGEGEELRGDVVLATSGFDQDPELIQRFWGIGGDDYGTVAPPSIGGDGIRLAEAAGVDVVEMPADMAPLVPGYRVDRPGRTSHATAMEHCLPHSFIVNRGGRRFCDDDTYWSLTEAAVGEGASELPFFMIWDEQHHQKYGLGATPPGGAYPDGLVTTALTLQELGDALGVDGEQLQGTADAFNVGAIEGRDPQFARGTNATWGKWAGDARMPNPTIGPVEQGPFHGMRIQLTANAIGMTGVRIDADARALRADGTVVEGLHVVGSAAAYSASGTGYNSGYALSRAITHGYLVGRELGLAADPVDAVVDPAGVV